jgi:hypothetical protein
VKPLGPYYFTVHYGPTQAEAYAVRKSLTRHQVPTEQIDRVIGAMRGAGGELGFKLTGKVWEVTGRSGRVLFREGRSGVSRVPCVPKEYNVGVYTTDPYRDMDILGKAAAKTLFPYTVSMGSAGEMYTRLVDLLDPCSCIKVLATFDHNTAYHGELPDGGRADEIHQRLYGIGDRLDDMSGLCPLLCEGAEVTLGACGVTDRDHGKTAYIDRLYGQCQKIGWIRGCSDNIEFAVAGGKGSLHCTGHWDYAPREATPSTPPDWG